MKFNIMRHALKGNMMLPVPFTHTTTPLPPPAPIGSRYTVQPDNCVYEIGQQATTGPMYVSRLVKDVFLGTYYAELAWMESNGNSRAELVKKGNVSDTLTLRNLSSLGAPVHSNLKATGTYLEHCVTLQRTVDEAASQIGWCGQRFWVPGGAREFVEFPYPSFWKPAHGANDNDVKAALKELLGWGVTPGLVIVGASLASPLVEHLSLVRNPIVTLSKKSNSGKTTVAKFAVSFWGNPLPSKTLYLSKATGNGLVSFALERNGLPIALDDTQNSQDAELSDVIYSIAEGSDKARASQVGKSVLNPNLWKGVFISTGEFSVLTEAMGTGAINRIIEMSEPPLGECDNAETLRRVKLLTNISSSHYAACRDELISLIESGAAVRETEQLIREVEARGVPSGTEGEIGLVAYGVTIAMRLAQVSDATLVDEVIAFLARHASITRTVAKSKECNAYDELVNIAATLELKGELLYAGTELAGRYHRVGSLSLLSVLPSARAFSGWAIKYGQMSKYYPTWGNEGLLRVTKGKYGVPIYTHSVRLLQATNSPRLPNLILQ